MAHQIAGRKFGRDSGHRRSLYRNLATDVLGYEKVTTTEAKAKEVRRIVEKLITLGKKGDLAARRQALAYVYDDKIADKVFGELATRYAGRPGGYSRITKLGPRQGDGAPMAQIELINDTAGSEK
jgi:large subunit ribosomal protein L17